MNHRHRQSKSKELREKSDIVLPFFGAVAEGRGYNPAAHGGIRYVEYCSCGFVREVLVNGCHIETGDWYRP